MYCPKYIMYYTFMKVEQLCKAPLTKISHFKWANMIMQYIIIWYVIYLRLLEEYFEREIS